eukprot:SAG11_NODE_7437_length_1144_cov_1.015311_1_plen_252_part_00
MSDAAAARSSFLALAYQGCVSREEYSLGQAAAPTDTEEMDEGSNPADRVPQRPNGLLTPTHTPNLWDRPAGLPILIISGFLGSGKTTVLNRILANKGGLRVAVFVNELGAVDIDGTLVAMRDTVDDADLVLLCEQRSPLSPGSKTASLVDVHMPDHRAGCRNNGCICCTINENLVSSVNRVLADDAVSALLIETTGVADLLPLLDTLQLDEELEGERHVLPCSDPLIHTAFYAISCSSPICTRLDPAPDQH